jgi:photosystem II stability/assembly factor-like uncharacterized protein
VRLHIRAGRKRYVSLFVLAGLSCCLALPGSANEVSAHNLGAAAALRWRSIGPSIGGRVVAVAGVPGKTNVFYMGAVDGGVWRSTDYGNVWTNITDGTLPGSSSSIGAIAVALSQPSILYVGTGESDIRADFITGDGVFRSTDAGKTWQRAGLEETHTISGLVVDPRNPNVVYASAMGHVFKPDPHRGVFKTTDGGRTWRRILFVNDETGAIDIVMDPHHPDVLYAAMWQAYRTPWKLSSGGPGSGLYKTVDGGAHWLDISRNPGYASGLLGKIGVTVSAARPNVVYSIVQAKDGGVFRSTDGGATWRRVNADWSLRQRAFYYMSIFADPVDPATVYVPEVDALWVSHDGGATFSRLRTPHGDNHVLWIDPQDPRILLEGNDGGATVSTDGGSTWSGEHNQPTGQFYHIGLDDQFPFHVYGAQQDEGSISGPSASADGYIGLNDWQRAAYGESTFVAPQPGDPEVTYGSGYFSIFVRYDARTGQYRSVSPWPNYQEGASSAELKYRFGWTHPILFSPVNPKELLVGAQYVLRSDDDGETWSRMSPDLTRNDPATEGPSGGPIDLDQSSAEVYPGISALAVSPRNGDMLWAGSDDGLVHVTTDGGEHWRLVTPPALPAWTQITCIEPSHADPQTAYLSASGYMLDDFHPYIFKTTDGGAHWTSLVSGLPDDEYVFAVREDPNEPRVLFAGTKSSVYVSLDAGAHWQSLALNLPPVQVRDIAIDTRQGEVAIATHGRAFWILDNLALLEQLARPPAAQASADGLALYAPQTAWLSHAYGRSEFAALIPGAGLNPPFGATVFFTIPPSYNGSTPVTLTFTDAAGNVIRRFSLHLRRPAPQRSPAEEMNETPQQRKQEELDRLTAIAPGADSFQWDLRYPDATEVTGFRPPIAAGGLPDDVNGPVVTPGRYVVSLDYGGRILSAPLTVALDPRLTATPEALAARLDLQLRIHATLDRLDQTVNRVIAARDRIQAEVAAHRLAQQQAAGVIAALNDTIDDYVATSIQSSEGSLLHETKLRDHLAYLAADIDLAYDRPTPAQYAVFEDLQRQAQAAERALNDALGKVASLL